ncbi:hypothetical protein A1O1_06212 [Capronia coronata CBS 617.96]|uniref:Uncharacterized protein n=1 Tax=Capronia coronata CBS 617.96 TaxID=1182541 RepID=W9Y068_9EURO|nr:uncharacterized protein A1O1_06212 [Capronia coronata CBS 617.96]EXJ85843.1 hypothetical protein A1O1_06212 [Capronia coronata CBS 617.96]
MATHKASYITIDEYEFPKGSKRVATLILAGLMTLSARRKFIEPRSIIHDHLLARSIKATRYSKLVQDVMFYVLFGIHGIETVWFALTKLKRHNVDVFSLLGFKWLATVFAGGSFAIAHWDEVVEKKELNVLKGI